MKRTTPTLILAVLDRAAGRRRPVRQGLLARRRSRLRGRLVRAAVVTAAMGTATTLVALPARAEAPTTETFPVDDTRPAPFLSGACGFPVIRHSEGSVTVTDFTASDGTFTREITRFRLVDTFSANGHEIAGRTIQPILTVARPDGSLTVAFTGTEMFTLPGAGPVIGSAGRLLLLFSVDGSEVVLQEAGQVFGDPQAICSALAP